MAKLQTVIRGCLFLQRTLMKDARRGLSAAAPSLPAQAWTARSGEALRRRDLQGTFVSRDSVWFA